MRRLNYYWSGGGWFLLVCWVLTACQPEPAAPPAPDLSAYFRTLPTPVYQYQNNPLTPAGFALGRQLFYDPGLSKDGTISCGSCHQQAAAFADLNRPLSRGIADKLGTRNTPALANLRWNPNFFADGGVNHLELVPLAPLTNPVEMDGELPGIIRKLNRNPAYVTAFKQVFRQDSINSQQLFRALAQFTGELISVNSPYDQYQRGNTRALTADQIQGLLVFKTKCGSCHQPGLFTDHSFRNNGLDHEYTRRDAGRQLITHAPADAGKFKVPSLRNVALSAPYMHDGRFQTLAQVLEHYDNSVKPSATLDPALAGDSPGLALTLTEKTQILAFLEALTDTEFISDPRFADPF